MSPNRAILQVVGVAVVLLGAAVATPALLGFGLALIVAPAFLPHRPACSCVTGISDGCPRHDRAPDAPSVRWDKRKSRWIITKPSPDALTAAYLAADPLDPTATLNFVAAMDERARSALSPSKPRNPSAKVLPPLTPSRGVPGVAGGLSVDSRGCSDCDTYRVVGCPDLHAVCSGRCGKRPASSVDSLLDEV